MRPAQTGRWSVAFTLFLALVSSWSSEAQYTREIIKAPEQDPVTVQEDGTTILTGTALPEFLVVQNFLIKAHVSSRDPAHWQRFLAEIEVSPNSATANALLRAAGEILGVAEDIEVSHEPEVRTESLRAIRRLAALWRGVRAVEPGSSGSADGLEEYMDAHTRRQGKLIISPESIPNMAFLDELQEEFEQEVDRTSRRSPSAWVRVTPAISIGSSAWNVTFADLGESDLRASVRHRPRTGRAEATWRRWLGRSST